MYQTIVTAYKTSDEMKAESFIDTLGPEWQNTQASKTSILTDISTILLKWKLPDTTNEKFRDSAIKHPENAKLQQLYKQEVSVTVTVRPTVNPAEIGTQFKDATGTYEVTSADTVIPEVAYIKGPAKATVTIPATLTMDDVEYIVTSIAPKAFYKNKKVKKVKVKR